MMMIGESIILSIIRTFLEHYQISVLNRIQTLEEKVAYLMATADQIKAKQAEEKIEHDNALSRIEVDMAEFRRIIATKGSITEAESEEILTSIQANVDKLKMVDPDPSFPAVV